MNAPEISVVMAVYNGAASLDKTLASVLDQEGCDFEFIVIDDGSTDGSGDILDSWAEKDSRIKVVHQKNSGLTRALIHGCELATGEFIARQDAGDFSLPGRLARQVLELRNRNECVAVSCHTRFLGPLGEFLYCAEISENNLNNALLTPVDGRYHGPSSHGSVMFRRCAYEDVGGYRGQFYFAQDLDLWTRLVEKGIFAVVPDVLFEASVEASSISGVQTLEQRRLAELISRACHFRRSGAVEDAVLEEANAIRPVKKEHLSKRLARGNYFIGCFLVGRDPAGAANYFMKALRNDPRHWRACIRLIHAILRRMILRADING